MTKICTGCKIEKEAQFYGKDKKAFDGLNQKCKECCNARAKVCIRSPEAIAKSKAYRAEWQRRKAPILNARTQEKYKKNLEKFREQGRARTKRYLQTEKGKAKHLATTKEYEKHNREKISAQRKVRKAVLSGKLIRPSHCQICNIEAKVHGHHEDYNRPFDVIWMCSKCHLYHHQKYRFHRERLNEETPKGDAKV